MSKLKELAPINPGGQRPPNEPIKLLHPYPPPQHPHPQQSQQDLTKLVIERIKAIDFSQNIGHRNIIVGGHNF